MENIDEDIKILEKFLETAKIHRNIIPDINFEPIYEEEIKALENLLSRLKTAEEELETYKKIEEEIKQKAHYCLEIPYEHCKKYTTAECGKCIIEWARKKVEDDE